MKGRFKKILTKVWYGGGLLVLVGAAWPLVSGSTSQVQAYVFSFGALTFAVGGLIVQPAYKDIVLDRLNRLQQFGYVAILVSAILLTGYVHELWGLRGGEWLLALAVATVLIGYTAYRIPYEESRRKK